MRLIDADALKETIDREIFRHDTIDHVFQIIDDAPTIEPKRGEWINQHKWSNGFFERECSVCGAMKPLLRHTAKINFCPNCGAKMEKVEDEE